MQSINLNFNSDWYKIDPLACIWTMRGVTPDEDVGPPTTPSGPPSKSTLTAAKAGMRFSMREAGLTVGIGTVTRAVG